MGIYPGPCGQAKKYFDSRSTIILGGIYPTLVPEHAASFVSADLVVAGEVEEASDLWPDLSFYANPPDYDHFCVGNSRVDHPHAFYSRAGE